ncbi:MAG: glycerophosphodiester phosphodiesterase [Bacteroidales bacterium]|jgi:glycerophosphoryl diester phosphodiesterase|nr:glycerophosphodiester phosphodiesterase [Bacteroidales bacterium]
MKKLILSVFFVSCILTGFSQLPVLDGYTIPLNRKGAVIGNFVVPEGQTVALLKDESGIFMISNNSLLLKKNVSLTAGLPFSYTVTVQCGNRQKTFELVKDEFIRNKVIAHRGAWKNHAVHQNSLGSLKHAVEIGCEGSEFDVWLTKDGKVALNHDYDLEGLIVEKTDLANLQKIPLEAGEVIPILEEYIKLIKTQNKTRLVLEIKSNNNKRSLALADSCVHIVHRMNAQAWVDYISFDYEALKRVRALDATAHVAYLTDDVPMDLLKIDGISGIDYHYALFDKIQKLYNRARLLGLSINVWTVNDRERLEKFLNMGVDFITTDEPELLLQLIGER